MYDIANTLKFDSVMNPEDNLLVTITACHFAAKLELQNNKLSRSKQTRLQKQFDKLTKEAWELGYTEMDMCEVLGEAIIALKYMWPKFNILD